MPGFDPTAPADLAAAAFAFAGSRMFVRRTSEVEIPSVAELGACGPVLAGPFALGRIGELTAVAVALRPEVTCAGLEARGLRELFGLLPEPIMALAARAFQTLEWSMAHAFCGRCGTPTVYSVVELARCCPSCAATYYPRITPAVITLVRRGSEILLARGRSSAPRFYSLIAGFVEPGETLEQAVEREVGEEVGIEVRNVTYFASQSWPFPSQLMVGFTADHAAGSLRVNESELSDARWFPIDDLPGDVEIPTNFSISGRLIRSALRPTPPPAGGNDGEGG